MKFMFKIRFTLSSLWIQFLEKENKNKYKKIIMINFKNVLIL